MPIDHLSSSQIRLYMQCALKYKYQYIDGIPRLVRPSALAFGSAVHSALSWLHTARMKGTKASLDQLLKIFEADWYSQRVETDLHYKDGEEEGALRVLGREMLGLYFHRPYEPVRGTEVPFTVPLANPTTGETLGINLEGFFDLLETNDTIVEFKTSAQAIAPSEVQSHLQLTSYGYAYEFLYGRRAKAFKLVNFIKGKKPRIEVSETTREKSHYEMFFSLAEQILRGIRAEIFFPRTGFWCKDCEYRHLCPVWSQPKVERREESKEVALQE